MQAIKTLHVMAWFFMLASGQNMCSKNESNANNNDNKYCTNVTDLIQQLTAQIIRLETKIDTLSAIVNKSGKPSFIIFSCLNTVFTF